MQSFAFMALRERAQQGLVTAEEMADVMVVGMVKCGQPAPDRAALVAKVRARHPTDAEVSAFILEAIGLYERAMLAAGPTGGSA